LKRGVSDILERSEVSRLHIFVGLDLEGVHVCSRDCFAQLK